MLRVEKPDAYKIPLTWKGAWRIYKTQLLLAK